MRLGAYYWDGWYARNVLWTERLLKEFPDRMPLWGWLGDTVENMEMQIDYAADAGLKFFAFDWYFPEKQDENIDSVIHNMGKCVDRYLQAENSSRMEFCLLIANHEHGYIYQDRWDEFCARVLPYLTSERALKIDGKPVIIFFLVDELERCLGGVQETNQCLDRLRSLVKEQGLPGVYVMGCTAPPRSNETGDIEDDKEKFSEIGRQLKNLGLDGMTGYNYMRPFKKSDSKISYIHAFDDLSEEYQFSWDRFIETCDIPYMPVLNGGYDRRPWEDNTRLRGLPGEKRLCYCPDRTPVLLHDHIMQAGLWIEKHKEGVAGDDLSIIYAWNENGEGAYLMPTLGDQGRILHSVQCALKEFSVKQGGCFL